MLNLREFRKEPDRLSDVLPWACLIRPGVVLNKDGSFQSTIQFRGPDLESSTEEELVVVSARINNAFKRLGSGWALFIEANRLERRDYPESQFPDPITHLIDQERKALFESKRHFESSFYLTLVYLPPTDTMHRVSGFFTKKESIEKKEGPDYEQILGTYLAEVSRINDLLETIFPETKLLNDEEVLTYLHSRVSDKRHLIRRPEIPMYLDALLSDASFITGFVPKLGKKFIKTISIRSFPGTSTPGIFDALNRLPIEYEWVTKFIALDKLDAEKQLKKLKRQWFSKRKSVVTLITEHITQSESTMMDTEAVQKSEDATEALEEVNADLVSFGYYTSTISIKGENLEELETKAKEVERIINSLGFVAKIEDVNATESYLGSIPGCVRHNVRRVNLHTLNLAHLMPCSAVWAGPEKNKHLNGPCVIYGLTNGSTQFRMSTHIGDVGHTLILGPTGAGKSVLLNLLEAQFRKYPDAQIYIFDKGKSAKVLTHGVGGEHFSLGAEDEGGLSFQPLKAIDNLSERRWAHEWLIQIISQENVEITPKLKERLWTALSSLASSPESERTLFGLTVILQDAEIREALMPYTTEGAHGHILDSSEEKLHFAKWQCFEMEQLMETPSVVFPVLSYIFHRLEKRLDGSPTLIVLDEAWLFLDNPQFRQKIREYLKVLRKQNASVIFATQSLADVQKSEISSVIKESCLTKIYLPNASALNPESREFYQSFGLNDRQIRILAESTPKRHYYYTSEEGNRLFELGLEGLALSYVGATGKTDQLKAQELIKLYPESPNLFNYHWLKLKGLSWAAEALKGEVFSEEELREVSQQKATSPVHEIAPLWEEEVPFEDEDTLMEIA